MNLFASSSSEFRTRAITHYILHRWELWKRDRFYSRMIRFSVPNFQTWNIDRSRKRNWTCFFRQTRNIPQHPEGSGVVLVPIQLKSSSDNYIHVAALSVPIWVLKNG